MLWSSPWTTLTAAQRPPRRRRSCPSSRSSPFSRAMRSMRALSSHRRKETVSPPRKPKRRPWMRQAPPTEKKRRRPRSIIKATCSRPCPSGVTCLPRSWSKSCRVSLLSSIHVSWNLLTIVDKIGRLHHLLKVEIPRLLQDQVTCHKAEIDKLEQDIRTETEEWERLNARRSQYSSKLMDLKGLS